MTPSLESAASSSSPQQQQQQQQQNPKNMQPFAPISSSLKALVDNAKNEINPVLVLSDGTAVQGISFGAKVDAGVAGECVFQTGK